MKSISSNHNVQREADIKTKSAVTDVPLSKRTRIKKMKKTDSELIALFWDSPPAALFGQETVAAVIHKSTKTMECDRWRGKGIPYRKCSGRVLYKKADVISWIESHQLVTSTSEYEMQL
jgi:hypothetical protein